MKTPGLETMLAAGMLTGVVVGGASMISYLLTGQKHHELMNASYILPGTLAAVGITRMAHTAINRMRSYR